MTITLGILQPLYPQCKTCFNSNITSQDYAFPAYVSTLCTPCVVFEIQFPTNHTNFMQNHVFLLKSLISLKEERHHTIHRYQLSMFFPCVFQPSFCFLCLLMLCTQLMWQWFPACHTNIRLNTQAGISNRTPYFSLSYVLYSTLASNVTNMG